MRVNLAYGRVGLPLDVPPWRTVMLEPRQLPGLPDEAGAFRQAVRHPIGSKPLREVVGAHERLAVVIPDITRPLPSDRLLPWLAEELAHVPDAQWTIVNGTGSHRVNTEAELQAMVGPDVLRRFKVVNHSAHDPAGLALAGRAPDGHDVYMNREWVEADRRIVLGFIEPHFMAGFSGGFKGVFPAVADIDAIMRYHSAAVIGDPRSTWGRLEDNPTQDIVRAGGSLLPVDFLVNVTLNRRREITGFYCGDVNAAHHDGCRTAKQTAMVRCERPFKLVVTTNSGYPLDQNLYQAVKGMSAGAQIVEPGGCILAAARCNDGFPAHGNFRTLMIGHPSARAVLDAIMAPGFSVYDQWEAQLLAIILLKARVGLYSEIPADEVAAAHIEPVADIQARFDEELAKLAADDPVAVLPEGPMTIPYLA